MKTAKDEKLSYKSEADVQNIVQAALEDATFICNLTIKKQAEDKELSQANCTQDMAGIPFVFERL